MGMAILYTLGGEEELNLLHQKLREGTPLAESLLEIGPITVDVSDEEYIAMVEKAAIALISASD